jgi:hypothetical protein
MKALIFNTGEKDEIVRLIYQVKNFSDNYYFNRVNLDDLEQIAYKLLLYFE